MMSKKYGKIILAVIIMFQIMIPVTMVAVKNEKVKALKENGIEIKVKLDSIYSEKKNTVYLCSDTLSGIDYHIGYVTFENDENGYAKALYSETKPENGLYVKKYDITDNWGCVEYYVETEDVNEYYEDYYNAAQEEENIKYGYCEPPVTEAYMTMRIYKGEYSITGVYVNGVAFDEYLKMCENGEFDLGRFDWQYNSEWSLFDEEEGDSELGEYTEPYVA